MTEDLDPIGTALDWLKFIVNNRAVSEHDVSYILTEVIPKATEQYLQQKTEVARTNFEKETAL